MFESILPILPETFQSAQSFSILNHSKMALELPQAFPHSQSVAKEGRIFLYHLLLQNEMGLECFPCLKLKSEKGP